MFQVGSGKVMRLPLDELYIPLATAGASILSSTVRAAGSVVVARELEGMPEGEEVEVLLYDDEFVDFGKSGRS